MPTGLPSISNIAESSRSSFAVVLKHIRDGADYLCIPSSAEYSESVRDAYVDFVRATKSGWHLFHLTFRPLFILLAFLSRYIAIVLKILAECTIKHGIVAAREGAGQARVAVKWFVSWQRSLSRGAILAELGLISAIVGMYLLRRHIRRKRYVERVRTWSARKKARALRKYNSAVAKVSRTSMFLAKLLPHALFILVVTICKFVAPWLLRYFATKTYLTRLISLWIPFVRTVILLHKWTGALQKEKEGNPRVAAASSIVESKKNGKATNGTGTDTDIGFKRKKSSKIAERYLKATEESSMPTESFSAGRNHERKIKRDVSGDDAVDHVYEEAMDLLKYWVVYALILSIFRTAALLPIVGRMLSVENPSHVVASNARRWPGKTESKSIWSSLRLSYQFVEETKLVFFLWLRYLPTSLTAASHHGNNVQKKAAAWEQKSVSVAKQEKFLNSPLDIIYRRLAPIAVAAADSSSNLSQATDSDTGLKGLLHQGMKFISSFLQVAVFMKVISDSTKNWIETTLVECSALIPAAITLLMPGYFTEFGCIYVSNVVPSANSSAAHSVLRLKYKERDHALASQDLSVGMRFLKYWVAHSLFSVLLSSFAPILNWVPLSTHITWLLWAYIQLESPTNRIYAVFEWELKAFGLLHRHDGDSEDMDLGKTMTVSVIKKVSSALPSASAASDDCTAKEEDAKQVGDEAKDVSPEGHITAKRIGEDEEARHETFGGKEDYPETHFLEGSTGSGSEENESDERGHITSDRTSLDAEGREENDPQDSSGLPVKIQNEGNGVANADVIKAKTE